MIFNPKRGIFEVKTPYLDKLSRLCRDMDEVEQQEAAALANDRLKRLRLQGYYRQLPKETREWLHKNTHGNRRLLQIQYEWEDFEAERTEEPVSYKGGWSTREPS